MPAYRVNEAGVRQARRLIDAGSVDVDTEWSRAAPSAAQENDHIAAHGHDGYGQWHLAVDPDASEETKKRYAFPFGDFTTVNRAALVHAKQRAAQNDHPEIAEAAGDLLHRLDDRSQ
ncbi:hypothetical protein ACI78Q_14345 [Geodermatophilus sp. SYSU D00705]